MDNIKQYFIRSTENNVVETVNENKDMICNEPKKKVEVS